MWDRRARLVRVKDGDTIVAVLDQGFRDEKEIDVRLLGVYAPELHETGGPECKTFVEKWFAQLPFVEWPCIVTTVRMKTVDAEQMTFDRYVALVNSLDMSQSLNVEICEFIRLNGFPGGVGAK